MGMKIILAVFLISLRKLNIPIYATHFTLGLIELKLEEHRLLWKHKAYDD